MTLELEVQRISTLGDLPSDEEFTRWAKAALADENEARILVIRLVDEEESTDLNLRYRGKHKPTNVLSFPADLPEEIAEPLLGDLVVCAPVVRREAIEQGKAEMAHWAHMIVHGVLHLRGFDHIDDTEAEQMESLETAILDSLGIADPYINQGYPVTNE